MIYLKFTQAVLRNGSVLKQILIYYVACLKFYGITMSRTEARHGSLSAMCAIPFVHQQWTDDVFGCGSVCSEQIKERQNLPSVFLRYSFSHRSMSMAYVSYIYIHITLSCIQMNIVIERYYMNLLYRTGMSSSAL